MDIVVHSKISWLLSYDKIDAKKTSYVCSFQQIQTWKVENIIGNCLVITKPLSHSITFPSRYSKSMFQKDFFFKSRPQKLHTADTGKLGRHWIETDF